ncbi:MULTISPECIES: YggT family protein [Actinomadura]|uniref:YggT family protein n=3 Tax=Actinomadura TaxID=1988 RepID=A0A846Z2L1_9ACTN|nr:MULTISPECIES: YggT family protein [Actinomadura]CNG58769.1 transmembrane protein [Mycobacterium tuberculosis]NEA22105.1 YggT family protein [Actinomadura bangladeshensis]NKZ07540.1 YggT family protein [Actinomadura latina]NVI91134.1 YggT family protein [Actinomadura sp. BRA 177]TDC02068.1 YggT family protein [Actinomadura bangladeshensis]
MNIAGQVLTYLLYFFLLFLIGRLVLEVLQSFARQWKPSGVVLVIAEATYTVTDPPLKLLRRFIPPVRLGNVALDLSFTVLILVVWILIMVIGSIFGGP